MKIAVGSLNPAKVNAVRTIFDTDKVLSMNAESGVSDQPFTDEETIKGAISRANDCLVNSDADFAIGLEGGVSESSYGLFVCNWGALVTRDGEQFLAGGARILLPEEVAEQLRQGRELGPVMDAFTKRKDIRKKEWAIGVFTNEHVTRAGMFEHIVRMLAGQLDYARR